MRSTTFISRAAVLIGDIRAAGADMNAQQRDELQRRCDELFTGLQNPSLPSAARLLETAREHGLEVAPGVAHRITSFDFLSAS